MNKSTSGSAGRFTVREVEERTGVPASSLRQWERRYGFPHPQRSPNGYRFYSEADLGAIMRMRDLVSDGVPPSRAAVLVKSEPAPLGDVRSSAALASELARVLLKYEPEQAEDIYLEALAIYPVERVLLDIIRPALVRIGDLWHAGSISVAAEHFASNYLQGRLRALFRLSARGSGGHRIVVACAPGERHELGSLIVATMLRRAGFGVIYLGADMPLQDLPDLVQSERPDAVLLSATMPEAIEALLAGRQFLASVACPLILGGSAFEADPGSVDRLGGVFLGNDIRKVIPEMQAMLAARV